jgi:hypothetical protein
MDADNTKKQKPLDMGTSYGDIPQVPFKDAKLSPAKLSRAEQEAVKELSKEAAEPEIIDMTGNPYAGYGKKAFHSAAINYDPDPEHGEGALTEDDEPAEGGAGEQGDETHEATVPEDEESIDDIIARRAAEQEAAPRRVVIPAASAPHDPARLFSEPLPPASAPAESKAVLSDPKAAVREPKAAMSDRPPLEVSAHEPVEERGPDGVIQGVRTIDIGMEITLDRIAIVDRPAIEADDIVKKLFTFNPTIQVVLAQSGYSCALSALTLAEIHAVGASSGDLYSEKDKIFRTIYSHMENSSLGRIGYYDWLKVSSFYDLPTLYYGVYCMTFPESNPFDVTCGSCETVNHLEVSNVSLDRQPNASTRAKVDEILTSKDAQQALSESQMTKAEMVLLPDSKLITEIRSPSLWDYLELTKSIKPEHVQAFRATVGMMLFVSGLKALDAKKSVEIGIPAFFNVDQRNWFDTLSMLGRADGNTLSKKISERMETNSISYAIKQSNCSKCNQTIKEIPVDMEQILFIKIGREMET